MDRIENVTSKLDHLHEESLKEFEEYLDQTIYDLYMAPLRKDSRGTYRLGIEDIPRDKDQPAQMDSLFLNITGLPEEVHPTSTAARHRLETLDKNRTNRLVKGFISTDATLNAVNHSAEKPASHLEKGFTWDQFWETKRLSPRMIGWAMLAMTGVIILSVYAVCVLCVRQCCIYIRGRTSIRRETPRVVSPEPEYEMANLANLDNLSTVDNVNLYEVVPVQVTQVPPVRN